MALKDSERAMERLKLKKEQLELRIRKDELLKRQKDVALKLKSMGGRIR